ncbi:hypothetical protein [Delftia sp. PS-11]|uniref:hypothetical protein n=1 Tax=Delftia sp. PS-11 TaxID=2767222 RepID=UPI002453FC64|nr:hypothetical protein [Delftia sp. PS-11]KAJ8742522.1 hypothetical protein H9T68_20070 [Delftia sp. PS-11]
MALGSIIETAINPALALLPAAMDTPEARVMLLTIGLQESRFVHRYQLVKARPGAKGPARGFWQFELGTRAGRGGVWGVYLHPASRYWLSGVCVARGVAFEPRAIWKAIEQDDVLAAALARLLLFTDPRRLPSVSDARGAWMLYALRTWRPGKPHRQTWDAFHAQARAVVAGTAA